VLKNKSKALPSKALAMELCDDSFITSDDEVDAVDNDLLAHLIKDISEVDFDEVELDTKLCDLMATNRKSKKSTKKRRSHCSK